MDVSDSHNPCCAAPFSKPLDSQSPQIPKTLKAIRTGNPEAGKPHPRNPGRTLNLPIEPFEVMYYNGYYNGFTRVTAGGNS